MLNITPVDGSARKATASVKTNEKDFYKPWKGRGKSHRLLMDLAQMLAVRYDIHEFIPIIANEDVVALCTYEIPLTGITSLKMAVMRQIQALFQKNVAYCNDDAMLASVQAYISAEQSNRRINTEYEQGVLLKEYPEVVHYAQNIVQELLGPAPSREEICEAARYGSGKSSDVSESGVWSKLTASLGYCTEYGYEFETYLSEFKQFAKKLVAHYKKYDSLGISRVDSMELLYKVPKLVFITKNYKSFRPIEVQPALMVFFQKAIGGIMKKRLLKGGVNLYDQSINQSRAHDAKRKKLCTVDLKGASDSVSIGIVLLLAPIEWIELWSVFRSTHVEYTDAKRDPVTKKRGTTVFQVEKFSSMGNGFTFELESTIFYALTVACCRVLGVKEDVTVYGDDIIAPAAVYSYLKKVLTASGFTVNSEKTFYTGDFYESCGVDIFKSKNVRPCYVKDNLSDSAVYSLLNYDLVNWGLFSDEIRLWLTRQCECPIKKGPPAYGDGHIHEIGYILEPHKRFDQDGKYLGWGGYIFSTYSAVPWALRSELSNPHLPYIGYNVWSKPKHPVERFNENSTYAWMFNYSSRFGRNRNLETLRSVMSYLCPEPPREIAEPTNLFVLPVKAGFYPSSQTTRLYTLDPGLV